VALERGKDLAFLDLGEGLLEAALGIGFMFKEGVDLSEGIEFFLMFGEGIAISIGFAHCFKKSITINEGEERDRHPLKALAIDVKMEVSRVKINYLRLRVTHELTVAQGDSVGTLLGEDRHQLLKRLCWFINFKLDLHG